MDSRFGNSAKVVGTVEDIGYNTDIGTPLGKVRLNADGNNITVQMWEKKDNGKPLSIVKDALKSLVDGDKYRISGELDESKFNGDWQRRIANRMISKRKNKVYGIDKVSETSEEMATARLSGDVVTKEINLVKEVRGQEVEEKTPKAEITLGIFDQFDVEKGENNDDMTRQEVLLNEVEYYIDTNDDVDAEIIRLKEKIEDTTDIKKLYMLAEKLDEAKDGLYNLELFHLVAYGDIAEQFDDKIKQYDNITVGCDINTEVITNKYDIVQGNLNELEVGFIGTVHEQADVDELGGFEDGFDNNFEAGY
jgi:hypothetical protein